MLQTGRCTVHPVSRWLIGAEAEAECGFAVRQRLTFLGVGQWKDDIRSVWRSSVSATNAVSRLAAAERGRFTNTEPALASLQISGATPRDPIRSRAPSPPRATALPAHHTPHRMAADLVNASRPTGRPRDPRVSQACAMADSESNNVYVFNLPWSLTNEVRVRRSGGERTAGS